MNRPTGRFILKIFGSKPCRPSAKDGLEDLEPARVLLNSSETAHYELASAFAAGCWLCSVQELLNVGITVSVGVTGAISGIIGIKAI